MQIWNEVLKVALVGTERQALALSETEEPVGRLLAGLNVEERERTLLRASGLLAGYRRAGYRPPIADTALPQAVEAEEKRPAPFSVMQDLMLMLAGEHREALPEWLQLVAEKGWRIPEEHLADLLDFGRRHPEFRGSILPVLGLRGRWLAAQNPEWKYALQISLFEIESMAETEDLQAAEAERGWQTGTKEERVALLHRLRRSASALARTLVESTWKQDASDERAAFLATFETGLSLEDEPFLEEALDDKRKEVRLAAQDLLSRLPESRLCLRMWERVRPLIRLQTAETAQEKPEAPSGVLDKVRSLLGAKPAVKTIENIAVELPQECDKAMIRDGIEPKVSYSNLGEKAWWLQQMLERVPLVCWSREWNRTPAEVIAANRSDEWKNLLLGGWIASLRRNGDSPWAVALFHHWIEHEKDPIPADLPWKEMVSVEVFEQGILRLLEKTAQTVQYNHPAHNLLSQHKSTWSVILARAVLENVRAAKGNHYYLASAMSVYAPSIPAEVRDEFFTAWSLTIETMPYAKIQLDNYMALNAFSKEMRRKIDAAEES